MDRANVERLVRDLLAELGVAPRRRGLAKAPGNVARLLSDFALPKEVPAVESWERPAAPGQMVILRDVGFTSLCEHHLLPFFGRCRVGFVPRERDCDVDWCTRVIEAFAHRLQLQERLTEQLADALFDALQPEGLGVVMDGRHMCMTMRGVEKQNSHIQTSALRGSFLDAAVRRSFFSQVLRGV